jgi:biopolymer transport protein ExbD
MMKIKQNSQKRARIEMIPLIDVMFLILAFFIYGMLSMVIHRGISVNLPRASSAVLDKEDYISLSIAEGGDIYLDKMNISIEEMEPLLLRARESNPKVRVFIRGDRMARYERVIEVLDIVRKAGISKVSMETEFGEDQQRPEVINQ